MKTTLRISGIVNDSIVDGTGIRMTIFTQGCPHHCKGCHNPQTHSFTDGYDEDISVILEKAINNPLLHGITLSGGEPFSQAESLCELCARVKTYGLNIWAYSGYTFEQLATGAEPFSKELLELCDVLVDGKYIEEKRNLELLFRGSSNQRIIDVKKSLKKNSVVLLDIEEV